MLPSAVISCAPKSQSCRIDNERIRRVGCGLRLPCLMPSGCVGSMDKEWMWRLMNRRPDPPPMTASQALLKCDYIRRPTKFINGINAFQMHGYCDVMREPNGCEIPHIAKSMRVVDKLVHYHLPPVVQLLFLRSYNPKWWTGCNRILGNEWCDFLIRRQKGDFRLHFKSIEIGALLGRNDERLECWLIIVAQIKQYTKIYGRK